MSSWAMRTGSAIGRFLFVVVLAAGIVAMHSTGHPDGTSAHAAPRHSASFSPPPVMDHASADHTSADHASATAASPSPVAHGTGSGMDMTSVCLAVLGTWAFARLLRAARARSGLPPDPAAALRLRHTRPDPPPDPPDLTRLSVLRI
ncbi:DUF6153 family protein [Streptomyces polyrhachis]|uniref:DUF6153 family protein n=1 Tax=Streptomyces polyrhachis TaxID=1282885 RepID=A0ABW2GIQ5_9ACTN